MPLNGSEWRELRQQIRMFCYRVAIELRSNNPELGSICPESLPSNTQIAKEKCHLVLSESSDWASETPIGKASADHDGSNQSNSRLLYTVLYEICKHNIGVHLAWNAVYFGFKAGCIELTVPEGRRPDGAPFFDLGQGEGSVFLHATLEQVNRYGSLISPHLARPDQPSDDWEGRVRRLRDRLPQAEADHLDIIIGLLQRENRRLPQSELLALDYQLCISTLKRVCAAATRDDTRVLTSKRGKGGGYGLPPWDSR